jgi:hypothetical protein
MKDAFHTSVKKSVTQMSQQIHSNPPKQAKATER